MPDTSCVVAPIRDHAFFEQTVLERQVGHAFLQSTCLAAQVLHLRDRWPQYNWPSIEARAQKRRPALGYLDKRLRQRMAAARAGIGKMHEQIFDIPAVLPPGMTALSIDQLCTLIRGDVSVDDPDNIEKLVWRKSLPIMHLAMATQLMLTGKYGDRSKHGCDLQDIDFYREAVRIAQLLEAVVHDNPEVAINRDQLTLIRWHE